MRNLQVFREERVNLQLDSSPSSSNGGEVIVAATYDSDRGRLFLASSTFVIYTVSPGGEVHSTDALLNGGDIQDVDRIVCMEFLLDKEMLVLGLAAGDIFQFDPESQELELVGAVEGGIVSLALSPDGELLVVATGLGKLLLMTQDWDVLHEMPLDQPPGSSRSEHIQSGGLQISWRGDGKYFSTLAAQHNSSSSERVSSTSSIKVWERDTGTLHSNGEPLSYLEPALSWSPSGACIATASNRADTREAPVVVLFERNGLKRGSFGILATPESKVLSLQWNSNSELLAAVIRDNDWDCIQVWYRSNFHWYLKQEWRYAASDNVKMSWDPEKPLHLLCWTASGRLNRISLCWKSAVLGFSTAFVIDGRNLLVTPLSHSIIPPPMFSFKVNFPSAIQNVAAIFETGSRFLIIAGLADGSASVFNLPTVESWDDLEATEFSASVVVSEPALDLGKLRHVSWLSSTTLVGSLFCDVLPSSEPGSISNNGSSGILDLSRECLVELKLVTQNGASSVDVMDKTCEGSEKRVLRLVNQTLLDVPVAAIAASPLNSLSEKSETRKARAFVQLLDGSVVVYSSGGALRKLSSGQNSATIVKFASCSPWMHAISHFNRGETSVVLIGLDIGGRLQVDDQVVSNECTSFTTHESITGDMESKITHLVFTTKGDAMHVINLNEVLAGDFSTEEVKDISSLSVAGRAEHPTTLVGKSRARMLKGVNPGTDSLRVRSLWERGAQLVSTVGGTDVAVILQTIRGNLETIYPRGLVLGAIATALNLENFQDAVSLARRHHINPNVLVDYKGWEEFCRAALSFVKQVQNLSHVTEVIQALTNENVMTTTYKNLIPVYHNANTVVQSLQLEPINGNGNLGKPTGLADSKGNKVREVLKAIRIALEKEVDDSTGRELCILTTLACSDPPELEAALGRIKALREAEVQDIRGGGIANVKGRLSAEAAVKHLIWLSDADSVFNAALGLYDLHLAAMVASNSQKDPKEFLPLLEELGNMPAAQMRYNIDCRLGKYESALRNCADMGSDHFVTCIELVKANPMLFPYSLQIFKDTEKRTRLLDVWGDHLLEEGKFEDAGATFCASLSFVKALAAYRLGGFWESAMTVAGRLGKSPAEIVEIATEVKDELQAMGRPREAAKLALDYCKDVEGAISLLLEAHDWLEVGRLAYLHERKDLVDSRLEPAVLESASTRLMELQEGVEKVGKYLARFLAIHQRRTALVAKLTTDKEGGEKVDDDASSDISLASSTHSNSSGLSGFSAYTHGTTTTQSATSSARGKGGRKQGRAHKSQGGRIRAGSPDEDLGLAEYLKGMALGGDSLREHRLLLQALLQLGHESIARRLQQAMSHFVSVQQDSVRQAELKLLESADRFTGQKGEEPSRSVPTGLAVDPLQRLPDLDWQWEILK
ncbi:unnamed protein product [Calypogeia fissa]